MSTNVVNLDALIPREDFAVDSGASTSSRLEKIDIRHLDEGFFLAALRKPDFQRETARWSPQKVLDLVRTFLDGDLIPSVILWQSGGDVFVIDGAHRISALIAWVHNDYGDGRRSLEFFQNRIPAEQLRVADHTRRLIKAEIGSYPEYAAAAKNPGSVSDEIRERVKRLSVNSLVVQWVPSGDAKAAEDSFFKINQAATPIDPTESRILKSRRAANALGARAIVRAGTGHKYWGSFPGSTQASIEQLGKQIYTALYDPPLGGSPIKTLDLPVAGRGYNTLPFVFDLVNLANGVKVADSTRKKHVEDVLEDDPDGAKTLAFLKKVTGLLDRVTGTHPASLGLHPVVYFYTRGGSFQPVAFLAAADFLRDLDARKKLRDFTNVRNQFEDFLLTYKHFMTQIVHKFGSGGRSLTPLVKFYETILKRLLAGAGSDQVVATLKADTDFSFLSLEITPPRTKDDDGAGKKFSRKTKSSTVLKEATEGAVRCSICRAMVHKNSMTFDHVTRRRDRGSATSDNAAVSHPYCNSTIKN